MKGLCASVWSCDCLLVKHTLVAAKAADESLCPSPWGDFVAAATAGQVMELIISLVLQRQGRQTPEFLQMQLFLVVQRASRTLGSSGSSVYCD